MMCIFRNTFKHLRQSSFKNLRQGSKDCVQKVFNINNTFGCLNDCMFIHSLMKDLQSNTIIRNRLHFKHNTVNLFFIRIIRKYSQTCSLIKDIFKMAPSKKVIPLCLICSMKLFSSEFFSSEELCRSSVIRLLNSFSLTIY